MKTFYDILKIKNNASNDEIIEAYNRLIKKYKNDKEMTKNIGIAKEILLNPDARSNYDKRINEIKEEEKKNDLISNISDNTKKYNLKQQELQKKAEEKKIKQEAKIKEEPEEKASIEKRTIKKPQAVQENKQKSLEEKKELTERELEKQRKREKRKQRRIEKKEDRRKQELYEEAYANYLQSLGFTVKRKWTWKRIKRLILSILLVILILFIMWQIPSIKKPLIQIYEENGVVKFFVDLIGTILISVWNGFKALLKVGD